MSKYGTNLDSVVLFRNSLKYVTRISIAFCNVVQSIAEEKVQLRDGSTTESNGSLNETSKNASQVDTDTSWVREANV